MIKYNSILQPNLNDVIGKPVKNDTGEIIGLIVDYDLNTGKASIEIQDNKNFNTIKKSIGVSSKEIS